MRARAIISRRAVEIGVAGGAHGRPTRHGPRADGERSTGDALGRGVPAASGSAFCRSSAAAALQIGRRGGGGRPHRGCAGAAGRCSPPVSTGAPGAACVARAGRGGAWRRRFGRRLGRGGGGSAAARAPARAARLRGGGSGSGSGAAVPARRGASGSRRRRFGFRRRRFGRGGSAFATSAAAAGVGSEFRSATGRGPPRAPFHHMATMTPSPAARGGKAGTRGGRPPSPWISRPRPVHGAVAFAAGRGPPRPGGRKGSLSMSSAGMAVIGLRPELSSRDERDARMPAAGPGHERARAIGHRAVDAQCTTISGFRAASREAGDRLASSRAPRRYGSPLPRDGVHHRRAG